MEADHVVERQLVASASTLKVQEDMNGDDVDAPVVGQKVSFDVIAQRGLDLQPTPFSVLPVTHFYPVAQLYPVTHFYPLQPTLILCAVGILKCSSSVKFVVLFNVRHYKISCSNRGSNVELITTRYSTKLSPITIQLRCEYIENDDEFFQFYLYAPKTNNALVFSVCGEKITKT